MEDARHDGLVSMLRCYEALEGSSDVEERKALWKAAKRYSGKGREQVARPSGLEFRGPRLHADVLGSSTSGVQ